MVLTLYYCDSSPPCRAVLLGARAAGIELNLKFVDPIVAKDHLKPEFLKINPQHTIPTLTDGDFSICESHAILGYLIHQYASNDKLYPKDPKKKALVDQRLHFNNGVLFAYLRRICFPIIFFGKTVVDEDNRKGLYDALDFLDKFLEGNKWVAGNELSIADFACISNVSSFADLGFNVSKFPNVKAWITRCQTLIPGYEELNMPGSKELANNIKSKVQPNQIY